MGRPYTHLFVLYFCGPSKEPTYRVSGSLMALEPSVRYPDITNIRSIYCRLHTPGQEEAEFKRNAPLMCYTAVLFTAIFSHQLTLLKMLTLEACGNYVTFIKMNVALTCTGTRQLTDLCLAARGRQLPHILASYRPSVCSLIRPTLFGHDVSTNRHTGVPHVALQPPPATRRAAPACNTNSGNLTRRQVAPNVMFSVTMSRESLFTRDHKMSIPHCVQAFLHKRVLWR
jgi:hypothetical protein